MKHFTIAIIIMTTTLLNAQSFSSSKKTLLKKVYHDHKVTFYCQNPYEIKQVKGKEKALIIQDSSKYTPRNKLTKKGKVNVRATRIEWEHIVPAHNFGRQLACWYNGDPKCVKKGKAFKGRSCCKKVSPEFKLMEADMMNLVPAIGEVNGDRSNFRFMDTNTELKGQYGQCAFKTDFKARTVYPADYTKGFIGRTYLYFSKKHGMSLSKRDRNMFDAWSKKYPATDWEKLREKRIKALQR